MQENNSNNILIQVENVSRFFGTHCAVKNVSFSVHRGEVLGFLGPNGAGKSTTMRVITGNLAPSDGRVVINGIDILDKPKQAKAHIGYLPEQPPLYREFTVDEYLSFCAKLNRIAKPNRSEAINRVKQRCGLADVGHRLIANLSKGYQQRVGIAQAIIHSPDVVILDEPTVGLDPIQIREIRQLIRQLGQDHSVILSSHILPEIQATCDRVQIINRGELVLSDSVDALQHLMQESSCVVGFQRAPGAEALQAVNHVEKVTRVDEWRFRIHYAPQQNPAPDIVRMSVNNHWELFELIPDKRSLEQVFLDITTVEPDNSPTLPPVPSDTLVQTA